MITWEDKYEAQLGFLKVLDTIGGTLRFDHKWIIASDIGSQEYCEKKVELGYIHGKVKNEIMILGTECHAKLVEDYEKVDYREAWRRIHERPRYWVAEIFLIAEYKGVFLVGRPDEVYFEKGVPRMVFEFKFSKYKKPFPSHHAQAQTYDPILHQLKFDTSDLFHAIVIFPQDMKDKIDSVKGIPRKIYKQFVYQSLNKKDYVQLQFGKINAYIYKYDQQEAERSINWAIKYWRGQREALFVDNKNKCKGCEFSQKCDYYQEG